MSRTLGTGRLRLRRNRPVEVYRPLRRADVTDGLLGKEVHILWPDNGVWYRAVLNEVRFHTFSCLGCLILPVFVRL